MTCSLAARLKLVAATLLIAALLIATPSAALAQAWVPPARSGALTVSFQEIEHTGHRLTEGAYFDNGRSRTAAVYFSVDYGVTRRFSISFGVPYVGARYIDAGPTPPPFRPVDQCRCWQTGWQDVGFTARVNLIDTFDHVFALTPSVSVGVPSHAYGYQGEAVVGRRLKEVRFAVDAGLRLDQVSRNLSISGRYEYAVVEQVLDIPNNRSDAWGEVAWRVVPRLSVRGFVAAQRTHGGLRAGSLPGSGAALELPGEINTPERVEEHDRLLRDNRLHAGAGVSYRISGLDLFATYTHFVRGTDTHAGRAFMAGLTWPFRLRR